MKLLKDMTEPELKDLLDAMAKQLMMIAKQRDVEKPLFILLLFNDPALTQYVANCTHDTAVEALYEGARRLAAGEDVKR